MRPSKLLLSEDFLREHRVLDVRVLVAVSGGADSLALLWLLRDAKIDIHVAHVNHGLRGAESDDDETFVRELCARQNIEYSTMRVEIEATNEHISEDAARQKRYAALTQIARENRCSVIATGHTADDNLETILLHMARGASVEGWNGIPQHRVLELANEERAGEESEKRKKLQIVRPILHLSRAQTEAICISANWPWRDDSSNSSTRYARNRVRHEVVPILAQIGNKSREVLATQTSVSANIRRDESAFLDSLAREHLQCLQLAGKPHALTLDGEAFALLHVAMQRRVLRLALREFGANDVGVEQLEAMRRRVVARETRCVWSLSRGLKAEWTGAMSGNRFRLWRVSMKGEERRFSSKRLI